MGTALVLLFLLALGAVPGALLPQRSLNASKVDQYLGQHPTIGPWLDRLQMFDVFSSSWFTAIYVLLFVSLVGCLTPRTIEHIRSLRATRCRHPRICPGCPVRRHRGARYSGVGGRRHLRKAERLASVTWDTGDGIEVSAEKGYLREFGNIIFHFAARPAGGDRGRQALRLRGQRHRHRQWRPWILLGLTRGVRLVPCRQQGRRHLAVSGVRASQRLPGELPAHRPGHVVRLEHRLPGRSRSRRRHLASLPAGGQPSAAGRR